MAHEAPTILNPTDVENTQFTFAWQIQGDNPDSYVVTAQGLGIKPDDSTHAWKTIASYQSTDSQYLEYLDASVLLTGLAAGTYYTLTVTNTYSTAPTPTRTILNVLTTGSSASPGGSTGAPSAPAAPAAGVPYAQNLVAIAPDDSHINLSWSNVGDAASIQIFLITNDGPQYLGSLGLAYDGSTESTPVDRLMTVLPATNYQFQVRSFNAAGQHGTVNSNFVTTPTRALALTHAGRFLIQSNFGSTCNYELFLPTHLQSPLRFIATDRAKSAYDWSFKEQLPLTPVPPVPSAHSTATTRITQVSARAPVVKLSANLPTCTGLTMIQSSFGIGNLEVVARFTPPNTTGQDFLVTYFYERSDGWSGPYDLLVGTERILGVTGAPSLIQGSDGNFELLVPRGVDVLHLTRMNSVAKFPWAVTDRLPRWSLAAPSIATTAVAPTSPGLNPGKGTQRQGVHAGVKVGTSFKAPTLVPVLLPHVIAVSCLQSNQNVGEGTFGAIEVVACLQRSDPSLGNYLVYYYYSGNNSIGGWSQPQVIYDQGTLVDGITGPHTLVQSNYDTPGRLELLIPHGDTIDHYTLNSDAFAKPEPWQFAGSLPRPTWPDPLATAGTTNHANEPHRAVVHPVTGINSLIGPDTPIFSDVSLIQDTSTQANTAGAKVMAAIATVQVAGVRYVTYYPYRGGWDAPATLNENGAPLQVPAGFAV